MKDYTTRFDRQDSEKDFFPARKREFSATEKIKITAMATLCFSCGLLGGTSLFPQIQERSHYTRKMWKDSAMIEIASPLYTPFDDNSGPIRVALLMKKGQRTRKLETLLHSITHKSHDERLLKLEIRNRDVPSVFEEGWNHSVVPYTDSPGPTPENKRKNYEITF